MGSNILSVIVSPISNVDFIQNIYLDCIMDFPWKTKLGAGLIYRMDL